ncbi:hemolysin family protein [Paracidobacterium acidisoli]|uniref:HlyC/CorC family transporter n=1 Tax=Paracidobacterium acidisoli TaxID=2303751 RepID=A0A372IPQ8_9BACT|nr:hemolysin family protein [Paracidobacterium acidisoli]MBT9331171.1 hemolysin family protein [Paracidobacterium acidisoli]
MTPLAAVLIAVLLVVLTFSSYIERLYSEMGRLLAREFQENIDVWEQNIEPHLGLSRERIALSAAILAMLAMAGLTFVFSMLLFDRPPHDLPAPAEIAQVALGVVLVIVLFNQLLPFMFFTRTQGLWVKRWTWLLRVMLWAVLPITLFLQFLLSIAALAESREHNDEADDSGAVDALLEAGEEEGIIEESARDLVRSAVEFGDKVVREVMTPRPEMMAVPGSLTLEQFLEIIRERPLSRVPVFSGTLDNIIGIAFTHDLLQVTDEAARTRTVTSIQRPAMFVPETKKVNELLREMQRDKQHMSIVIDEYGGVAGLVTIEDLIEELVGAIRDEHEDEDGSEVTREPGGAWVVPGSLEITRLEELLEDDFVSPEDMDATTVGGLVSETAGRIPLAGEVIEKYGLRFEVTASTDRRIVRLRVSRAAESAA